MGCYCSTESNLRLKDTVDFDTQIKPIFANVCYLGALSYFRSQKIILNFYCSSFSWRYLSAIEQIKKLAPYVQEGETLTYVGENGSMWRFLFKNNTYIEQEAVISWRNK